jgi:inosose dehydratase
MRIRVASAPVSWGIMENVPAPPEYPYARVLDEIAQAGYSGTELGPYGFLPMDAHQLRGELDRRSLALCSAFVAIPLGDSAKHNSGFAQVEQAARLISQAGARLLILSDEVTPDRSRVAGRPEEANRLSWSEEEWMAAEQAIREVIERCGKYGLKVAFHPHAGSHVETPEEVDHLLSRLPAGELGLCLDTGHFQYGGGDPMAALQRYIDRVWCVHLKDIDEARLSESRQQRLDFHAAVRSGVFARLGDGVINFAGVLAAVANSAFDGWLVVEQDVLAGGRGATAPLENSTAGRQFLRKLGY